MRTYPGVDAGASTLLAVKTVANGTCLPALLALVAACSSGASPGSGVDGGPDSDLGLPTDELTVSGATATSIAHGEAITITGAGFGAKATAPPVIFQDFEQGTEAAEITTADGWSSVDGWSESAGAHTRRPYFAAAHKHAGKLGMTCNNAGDTANSSVRIDADYSRGFYLDAWYQYAPAAPASRNHKVFMLYGDGANELPQAALTGFCRLDEGVVIPFYAGPNDGDADWLGLTFNDLVGEMKHLQVWLQPSTPGQRDGKTWLAVDGTVYASAEDLQTVMPDVGHWVQARIGYYMSHAELTDCPASGDAYTYWDDVYVDTTQARIELGNQPRYDDCTHREIQLPTTWRGDAITFQVNQGTFASGDPVYVFVVNAGGAASPGFPLTIQ